MVHELGSDNSDVEIMKRGLKEEGWVEDEQNLPHNWFVKTESTYRSVRFITADFEIYKTGENIVMKNTGHSMGKMTNHSNCLIGLVWLTSYDLQSLGQNLNI